MDTLTKSCSPTIVITANGEVQTHEEATVCVKELDIFLTMKVLEDTPAVLSLGKLCDEHGYSYEWINGQKPHLKKTVFGYSATRRTSFRSWFLACQRVLPLQHPWNLQGRRLIILRLLQVPLPHQLRLYQVTVRIEQRQTCVGQIPIQHLCQVHMLNGKNGATHWPSQPKNPRTNTNENHEKERWDPLCSDIPEWLQEFTQRLTRQFSSWTIFRAYAYEKCGFG